MLWVFVYGTLMRGRSAHDRLAGGVLRGEKAWTKGRLVHLKAGYPALLDVDSGRVHGELLQLSGERLLAELDLYEGYDSKFPDQSLYHRVQRMVVGEESGTRFAWCYVMPAALESRLLSQGAQPLSDGRWPDNVSETGA